MSLNVFTVYSENLLGVLLYYKRIYTQWLSYLNHSDTWGAVSY